MLVRTPTRRFDRHNFLGPLSQRWCAPHRFLVCSRTEREITSRPETTRILRSHEPHCRSSIHSTFKSKGLHLSPITITTNRFDEKKQMDPHAKLFSPRTNSTRLSRALAGIKLLDRELAMMYFQILWNVLRKPMQQVLKGLVMENRTETNQELWAYEQCWMQCGFREGEVKGEIKAVRENIFRLAERRGLLLSDEQQARLRECNDRAVLDRWFDDVFDAQFADELFQ